MQSLRQALWRMLILVLPACGLTMLFWGPLWRGGGFIGGDVYSYYLPQKQFLSEQLAGGHLPLWNNRGGHGYPLVGESQTGVFYPPHLLLYGTLPLNTAYNASHLLHYILAFVFAFLLARKLGLSAGACGFAAFVFTYAWFPVRACWEWAVITGSYLPLVLWCIECYLQSATRLSRRRSLLLLSLALALQLLAGHFSLAFATLLIAAAYSTFRVLAPQQAGPPRADATLAPSAERKAIRDVCGLGLAVLAGLLLAAVQLLPTWELKQHSQRRVTGVHHDLRFGSIPVDTWSQLLGWTRTGDGQFVPWASLLTPRDELLSGHGFRTNQVEAQLSCGLFPLGLALVGALGGLRRLRPQQCFWTVIATGSLLYTSGVLTTSLGRLPGFSYFQGPGRMGILFILAVAILASQTWDALTAAGRRSRWVLTAWVVVSLLHVSHLGSETAAVADRLRIPTPLTFWGVSLSETFWTIATVVLLCAVLSSGALASAALSTRRSSRTAASRVWPTARALRVLLSLGLCITLLEYWMTSRLITYSTMIASPPVLALDESPLRRELASQSPPPRVLSPGGNLLNMTGSASVPVYLTFGPAAYVTSAVLTPMADDGTPLALQEVSVAWMRRAGVTHVVSLEPRPQAGLKLLWSGFDPCFSVALNHRTKPLYLYRVTGGAGRVAWYRDKAAASSKSARPAELDMLAFTPDRIECRVETTARGILEFRELQFPGWICEVDGVPLADDISEPPAESTSRSGRVASRNGPFRRVVLAAGRHHVRWKYAPRPLYWGAVVSGSTLLVLLLMTLACWHKNRGPSSTRHPSSPPLISEDRTS